MYSSSYKHRPGTVTAFEDAYAKEEFLRRSATAGNGGGGCTPYSDKAQVNCEAGKEESPAVPCNDKKTPSVVCKPKKEASGLLSGMDGGDILLVLLILFFLADKDSENDVLIPVLLAILLIF